MTRTSYVLPIIAATLMVAPVALARDVTEKTTFTRANGTKVVDKTTLNTKTDNITVKSTITRTNGEIKTVEAKVSPDVRGGFTVSKSVTGFSGQTHTSTSHVGGGKKA